VSASTTTPSSSPSAQAPAQQELADANFAAGTDVRVSVVISVKNRSGMLTDCFRGLGAQTLARDQFEVVVIDNCSTEDLTPVFERARREIGLDIKVERTTVDKGPAPARNRGVALARGPIIAFTDSDCRPDPGWLAGGLAAFDAPEVAMVSGPVLAKPEQRATFTCKTYFVTHKEHPTFPTANLFLRRSVFVAHEGFDTSLSFRDPLSRATECADTDLAWRIIEAGHSRRFATSAVIYHEYEDLGLLLWILDPSRLFVVPLLVRRHPILRRQLLVANLFFYPGAPLYYACAAFAVTAILLKPVLLWVLPLLLVVRGMQRTRSLNPARLLRYVVQMFGHCVRVGVMFAALIYGSIRFRSLVL
jgi:glycosyltransferase involved in cell wall biosynthesis